jgi:AmmeMemoRadiSam system protein B
MRKPAVAGKFYPSDSLLLMKEVDSYIKKDVKKSDAIGVISPHAGFFYSGGIAGEVFSCVNIPDQIILLGPNHTGYGETVSIVSGGSWTMPYGEVKINSELANLIKSKSPIIKESEQGHKYEHSLEVQLPFLNYFEKDINIVPIVIKGKDMNICMQLGKAISSSILEYRNKVLIVASSDMNHYEEAKATKHKDNLAIDEIVTLDPVGLFETVNANDISMCGIMAATTMLLAAKELGASSAELVRYTNSGEKSGDYRSVVGYAGILVK